MNAPRVAPQRRSGHPGKYLSHSQNHPSPTVSKARPLPSSLFLGQEWYLAQVTPRESFLETAFVRNVAEHSSKWEVAAFLVSRVQWLVVP